MNFRKLGYFHLILMCFLIGSMSQKRKPEALSKINWNARKAGEEASQVTKQQYSDTHRQPTKYQDIRHHG